MRKTLELGKDFQRANDSLSGVFNAGKIVVVQLSAKAALAVSADIAENGGTSRKMVVADLDEKARLQLQRKVQVEQEFWRN